MMASGNETTGSMGGKNFLFPFLNGLLFTFMDKSMCRCKIFWIVGIGGGGNLNGVGADLLLLLPTKEVVGR